MLANLMRRGHAMRDAGDVSAARLLFRRAAEAGSAAAATALGKTYDPDSLNGTGARTIGADRTAAMHWYEQGAMRGDLEASRLLKQLNERTPSP
jgi:TPR repeat protein